MNLKIVQIWGTCKAPNFGQLLCMYGDSTDSAEYIQTSMPINAYQCLSMPQIHQLILGDVHMLEHVQVEFPARKKSIQIFVQ